MNIIIQKEGLYNINTFINTISKNFIDGIMLQVTITSDGKIILFNPVSNNYNSLSNIQTNTLNELKNQSIILIDNLLNELSKINKKIYLELVPFDALVITDKTVEQISKFYKAFVTNVLDIVNKHNNLDISLCSINESILYHLKNSNTKYKIGMIFEPQNLNYIDLDFYIFSYTNFNNIIINELLNASKDIMIKIENAENMIKIFEHIEKSDNKNELNNKLSIITTRPTIVNDYIKEYKKMSN